MSEEIDVENLAHLARVDIDKSEAEELKSSIADILEYVSAVEEVADVEDSGPQAGPVRNVLRADKDPHEPGEYREQILNQAPEVDSQGYIVVPPILAR